jgi:hypothetical protein
MRLLLNVTFPHEPFNKAVREGSVGATMAEIFETTKPEAVYFTEQDGHRGALLVINVDDPARIPSLAEPWFLKFQADCKLRIVMSPDDLQRSGLEEIGRKWS